jgi:acetylornithine/succinyldiaminopimelate/putrescine aminotransferase
MRHSLRRTGTTFYVNRLNEPSDILLYAKCLGNGFPVSALALADHIPVRSEALPGSTFAGNPMALAAVEGTLTAMASLPMGERVSSIEAIVRSALGELQETGATLRGRGALWCVEFGDRICMENAHVAIRDSDW